jgi:Fe-S-cluster containining protein
MMDGLPMPDVPDDLPACAGCGICCHMVVELMPAVDDVPDGFVVEHDGVRCMDQRGDGACVALDPATRLCTIYERRPQVCRDFNRGEALCRTAVSKGLAALLKFRGPAS